MASDNFNRNEDPLSTNWSAAVVGTIKADGANAIRSGVVGDNQAVRTDSFNVDHYSEVVLASAPADSDGGPIGRAQAGSETFYIFDIFVNSPGLSGFHRAISGSFQRLGAEVSVTPTVGHTYRIECSGTGTVTIVGKDNGVSQGSRTDSGGLQLDSGSIGLFNFLDIAWTSWQGDNLSLGAVINQVIEINLAQTITRSKIRVLGIISETNLSQAIARLKSKGLGQITETNLAQTLIRTKLLALSQASETNIAQIISLLAGQTIVIGQVNEIDAAQVITWAPKHRLFNQVSELDIALAITVIGGLTDLIPGTVPIRYVVGTIPNVVPVETVLTNEIGVVPVREFVGPANVVPVRETATEIPRVKIRKV